MRSLASRVIPQRPGQGSKQLELAEWWAWPKLMSLLEQRPTFSRMCIIHSSYLHPVRFPLIPRFQVRDLATAEKFLATVARFKERVGWHGESAEGTKECQRQDICQEIHTATGNPSGGNKLRGLYNITLKSLGASVKRDPEVGHLQGISNQHR